MSSVVSEQPIPRFQVVDLCTVTPAELEGLWHHEEQWWREQPPLGHLHTHWRHCGASSGAGVSRAKRYGWARRLSATRIT